MIFTFAWRYFKAKKSTNAINIISSVSVLAILIGTAALIIILSAFNGFESLVKSLYSSFYSDLRISAQKGKVINLTEEQIKKIRSLPGVKAASLVAEDRALLQNHELQTVVMVKGVDDQYPKVSNLPTKLVRGRYELGTAEQPRAVMGVGIENAIGVLADRMLMPLTVYMPRKGVTDMQNPLEALSEGMLVPAGSFAVQMEFDNKYVMTNLDFARQYLSYGPDEYSSVELAADQQERIPEIKQALQRMLGTAFKVEDRFEQNRTLYTTINLEKWAIYSIFTLILLVASFNMVGALSMLVLEKKKDIQVLRAMGASESLIMKIFIAEGLVLAGIGAIGGVLLALLLYYLQVNYKLVPLQGDSFLIDYYPVKLVWRDFILVITTALGIGFLASWFPAYRASRQAFELRN
ncbi:MAG: FtsX-like permease family protein [Sphingobacteriales bacterium]|jgi:lipoprotein-releasing system permease protein